MQAKIKEGRGSRKESILARLLLSGLAPWAEYKWRASLTSHYNISVPFTSHPFGSRHRDSAGIVRNTLVANRIRGRPTDKHHPIETEHSLKNILRDTAINMPAQNGIWAEHSKVLVHSLSSISSYNVTLQLAEITSILFNFSTDKKLTRSMNCQERFKNTPKFYSNSNRNKALLLSLCAFF